MKKKEREREGGTISGCQLIPGAASRDEMHLYWLAVAVWFTVVLDALAGRL